MRQVGSRPSRTSSPRLSVQYNLNKEPLHSEVEGDDRRTVTWMTYATWLAVILVTTGVIMTLVQMSAVFFKKFGIHWLDRMSF